MWYAPIREITAQLRKHPRRRHKVRNMGMELPEGTLPPDAVQVPGAPPPADAAMPAGPTPSAYPSQAPPVPATAPASPRDIDIPAEDRQPKRQRIPHDGVKVGPRGPAVDAEQPGMAAGDPNADSNGNAPAPGGPKNGGPEGEGEGQGSELGPVPVGGPMPPLHEHCHCEIKTMPGGRKIWKSNGRCCQQCDQARDSFNQSQAQMFGE